MAGAEAFTILAILEAQDRMSSVMAHVDETLNGFASSAERAAEAARSAGTAIDESLLQTASGADALEVAEANLSATQARLALATQELAGAERELLAATDLAARSAEGDAVALSAQAAAAERLAAAQRMVRTTTAEVAAAMRTQAATADAAAVAADGGAAATSRWGTAATNAGAAMKTAGKYAMGAGLAAAAVGYESVKAALSFQTLLTRLVTSAGESKSNLDLVKSGILDISASVGVSANDVAKGMYIVESAGYHGAAGIQVLRAATEGAAIEGADFGTVSNAVTDVLKDYHLTADHATQATSALIQAVSYGKTNFQSMSSAMSNVLPLASSLGIKLEDVTGVLAEMTAHGMTTARASFNIANAMRSLSVPTKAMSDEYALFNLTAQDVQNSLGSRGLAGTLQWLSGIAKAGAPAVGQTYNEALKRMMGTATGLQVALLTTGENANDTNTAISGISNALNSTSPHVQGFAELQSTLANKLDRAKAAIHNAGIAIGSALLPAVTQIAGAVTKFLTPLAGWVEKHQKLTAVILGSLVALGLLAGAISLVGTVIDVLFSWVGLIVIAIAALVIGVIYCYTHFKTFHKVVNDLASFLKVTFVGAWKAASAAVDWFSKNVMPYVKKAIEAVVSWFSAHKEDFIKAWDTVVKTVQGLVKWFDENVLSWLKARLDDLVSWWKSHSDQIEKVWSVLWTVIQTAAKVAFGALEVMLNVLESIWNFIWGGLRDTIKLVWAIISGVISNTMNIILGIIGIFLDLITGNWGKAWDELKTLAYNALNGVWQFILTLGSYAGTLLYDAGRNIIKGLINGMKSMIGEVASAIGSVTSTIKKYLPWSPAKAGPLSGSGAPEIGGKNIVKLMAQGIREGTPQIEAAMSFAVSAVKARQQAATSANLGASIAAGLTGGVAGNAGNAVYMTFDLRESKMMSDRDMDNLVNKIGRQVATRILPAGGVRIRM